MRFLKKDSSLFPNMDTTQHPPNMEEKDANNQKGGREAGKRGRH